MIFIITFKTPKKARNEDLCLRVNRDPGLTKDEIMVATFTHEGFHDTDQQSIDAIKTRQQGGANNFDVENAAETKAEKKVYEEVKKKRQNQ